MERQRYSRDQWRDWLVEQTGSGVSITAFCRQKDFSAKTFYHWRNKLADEPAAQESVGKAFVPLSIVSDERVEIDLPCGATIRLPGDEATTRRVLSVLLELGGNARGDLS